MPQKKPFVTLAQARAIAAEIPTPFHLYDEAGIRENARKVNAAFSWNKGFKEYFAVKATPNPYILKILQEEGCGVDCSSLHRADAGRGLRLSRAATSCFPPTTRRREDMQLALRAGRIHQPGRFYPYRLAGRSWPVSRRRFAAATTRAGISRWAISIMDNPGDAKYGMTEDQMVEGLHPSEGTGREDVRHPLPSWPATPSPTTIIPSWPRMLFELAVRAAQAHRRRHQVHQPFRRRGHRLPSGAAQATTSPPSAKAYAKRLRRSSCPRAWAM